MPHLYLSINLQMSQRESSDCASAANAAYHYKTPPPTSKPPIKVLMVVECHKPVTHAVNARLEDMVEKALLPFPRPAWQLICCYWLWFVNRENSVKIIRWNDQSTNLKAANRIFTICWYGLLRQYWRELCQDVWDRIHIQPPFDTDWPVFTLYRVVEIVFNSWMSLLQLTK